MRRKRSSGREDARKAIRGSKSVAADRGQRK
jgi:hypothetical protein